MKYGLFIGRFQPMHIGHQSILNHIRALNFHPVVLIGSAQEENTTKNPLNYQQRAATFRKQGVLTHPLYDQPTNEEWVQSIQTIVNIYGIDNVTLFIHNKPSEAGKYGLDTDTYISDTIQQQIPDLPVNHLTDICTVPLNATDIRNSVQQLTHIVDQQTLQTLINYYYTKDAIDELFTNSSKAG